ncbi:MAG: ATP-binding protein [Prolixibacteraceae bacterium]|jgi:signal transduction histidine kinase/ligand-binding sensor domain-containing protein|nr:ATP-binding protein [Prolixibacteraceae bacterium]
MRYALLFFAIVCCLFSSANTVSPEAFMLFNTGNGRLKHNTVEAVCRDQMGFLWVGTNFGLNRLDGYNTINYTNNSEDTTSISANFIKCVYNDSKNNLWVGTIGGGLNLYDRQNNSFVQFLPSDKKNSISSYNITSIVEDKEGNIWIGTATKQLNKYVVEKDSFIVYDLDEYDPFNRSLSSIYNLLCDKNGNIWTGLSQGEVYRIKPENEEIQLVSTAGDADVPDIGSINGIVELDSAILFSTWTGKIYSVDHVNDSVLTLMYRSEIFDNAVLSEMEKGIGNDIWIASRNKGLFHINLDNNNVKKYQFDSSTNGGIGSNGMNDLFLDSSNNLWLAYMDNGIGMVPIRKKMFSQLKPEDSRNDIFKNIFAIEHDTHGNIWLGLRGEGLWKYNKRNGTFIQYDAQTNDGLNSNFILSLKWSSDDQKLYVGTDGSFMSIFDPATEKFTQVYHEKDDWSSAVFSIEENANYIWASTWGGGVKEIRKDDLTYRSINFDTNDQFRNSVFDMSVHGNFMWVANVEMGLLKYDLTNRSYEVFEQQPNDSISLPDERINTIYVQSDSIIWIGIDGLGVYKFNSITGKATAHYENEDVAQNVIQSIQPDQNNNLWVTNISGITHIDLKTHKVYTFNAKNGLVNSQFNLNSTSFDKGNNKLYAGGLDGVDYFQTNDIIIDSTVNEVVFTGLNVMGHTIRKPNSVNLNKSIEVADKVYIMPDENIITLYFSSLDFTPSQRNCYEYKLEGFNDQWVKIPYDKNSVNYTNLYPGEYTFKIKACNSDGVMGSKASELELIVKPAFWQTTWFYILVAVLLIGIAYLYYYIRNRKLIKSKKNLENNVHERTKEILKQKIYIEKQNTELEQVNKTKDRFFSIIGHDLRNPMANVNQLVDLVITEFKTASGEQIMKYLDVLQRSSETTIKLLDDLLIWSHTQNGKMEAKKETVTIYDLFTKTIETCQMTAGKKNVTLKNLNEENLSVVCDENMMLTVMRNIVTNAIKFSYPESEIFLNAHKKADDIVISVTDEGKGMSKKQFNNLFKIEVVSSTEGTGGETGSGLGLIICKEFVHANGGEIWAESKKGEGTTFFIALPSDKQ